ncbi:MAG TPA: hypothetical protein VHY08_02225 [Bacillota bacterium]|nr:hypothetical protein [Bacillota bacterium]
MLKRFLLSSLNYPLMDKDTGGGGGADDNTSHEKTPAGGGGQNNEQIVFPNQASFMERVKREGRSQFNEFIKELGFEKPEDLKTLVTKAKETEEKNKTDLQKAQEDNTNLKRENEQVKKNAEKTLIDAALLIQAAQANVKADRIKAFLKLVNPSGITVVDGIADENAVKTAIGNTLKEFPEFLTKPGTDNGGEDFGSGGGGQKDLGNLSMADYIKARTSGQGK